MMTTAPTTAYFVDNDNNDDNNDDDVDDVDWEAEARDIQNRMSRAVGTTDREARHFREFFGTPVDAVEIVWDLLVRESLLPEKGHPKHLLWALHFMKTYPKQGPACATVGASAGAVDAKTFRKWVWAFIRAIAELEEVVVSKFICSQCEDGTECSFQFGGSRTGCHRSLTTLPSPQLREYLIISPPRPHTHPRPRRLPPPQVDFESRKKGDVLNDCLMTINGTDFRVPQQGLVKEGNPFGSHKYAGSPPSATSWACPSEVDSKVILMGHEIVKLL
jgi:hypothetical protein